MSEPTVPPPPSYTPPPPPSYTPPPPGGGAVSPNRTLMIILSYLGPLALIPFLVEKEDREVQWHAKHGLVLLVADIAICIVCTVLSVVTANMGCGSGCVLQLLFLAVWVIILVVHVLCIIKGVNGQRFIIPGVSQYADRF